VKALVFLCSGMPGVGDEDPESPLDGGRPDDPYRYTVDEQDRIVISVEHAIGRYYQDCPPDVAMRMAAQPRMVFECLAPSTRRDWANQSRKLGP
jgi:hypothetical protein